MNLCQLLLLLSGRLKRFSFGSFAFNELLLFVCSRLMKMTSWIFGCLRGFGAFGALGNLGVFGPDQLLLLFCSRFINSTEALRKRFVHLNRNSGPGDII